MNTVQTENIIYDGAEKVPAEIRNVRNPIMFNMTGRELIFLVGGLAIAGAVSLLMFGVLRLSGSGWLLIPALLASPLLAFGFVHPGGLNLEDFLVIWWSNNIKSAPIRRLYALNAYEQVQELALAKRKADEKKAQTGKKGAVKAKKEKKPKSAYTVRF